MAATKSKTIDGNEAVARVAYQLSEVISIYPITPSSPMGEWADAWASMSQPNLWGTVPSVVEMQSEGGAAGALHGALQTGSLSTTFTASQGLLLMIPNMYKIAGELTPAVMHVSARTLATHALSIFGDHSDVMSVRSTGWAMLCSASVQEAHDMTAISHAATLESRVPFIHFFDGFRTSHEVAKLAMVEKDVLRKLVPEQRILEHRERAMSPDHPVLRGTAQNPDVYFQAREACNKFYTACPDIVEQAMESFGKLTGRTYKLYEYHGAPDADRVVLLMGSGCDTAHETVDYLTAQGEKVGILKVRLYRPFDATRLLKALPSTVRKLAVLDRTKEPGSGAEPLHLDVVHALAEAQAENPGQFDTWPTVVGGRYGLSSKEFDPAMVKAVFDNLSQEKPKNHFTVGIVDDVTHTSLPVDETFSTEEDTTLRGVFYGLGSDGTVGANKETIKIIGENTDNYAQAYFVYDSKKSGAMTVSHLRFGTKPIRSTYLITQAQFVGCHQPVFLDRFDVTEKLAQGGIVLLNTPHGPGEILDHLPEATVKNLIKKQAKLYVIDASSVARESGMGGRINTVMQVCYFSVSGVLPQEDAISAIKDSIKKTYGRKGEEIVRMNLIAVDKAQEHIHEVALPAEFSTPASGVRVQMRKPVPDAAPGFVRDVLGTIIAGHGDRLPVSAMPCDGTFPTHTARWEKRNLANFVPVWDKDVCIQCGKCVLVCPHATIRSKTYDEAALKDAPETFKSQKARLPEWKGLNYTIQVAVEDCTGCAICVDVCPARNKSEAKLKAINMEPQPPLVDAERENWDFFLGLPDPPRHEIQTKNIRAMQVAEPYFEFSGACAGCGETAYVKLATQLFGDRMLIANATGCSSIYGGNLPTTPYTFNRQGLGPSWSNSLFEDNAEFGLGFRVSIDKQKQFAEEMVKQVSGSVGAELAEAILGCAQKDETEIYEQRQRVGTLKDKLCKLDTPEARRLLGVADALVKKSVWILGGDGWGYDIGYGGLDHVLASGRNVNVLLLDTEVYSNTGGQMSKSTPRGAVAKFAAGGKPAAKKDLGLIAMSYGNIYVACIAMGAKDEHTLKAFLEAEAYDGPSLIIAYSHCIAHGIDMKKGLQNQKAAVRSGQWLLYRYDPDRTEAGENPLQLDSQAPAIKVQEYFQMENRFRMLTQTRPEVAKEAFAKAQEEVYARYQYYKQLASQPGPGKTSPNGDAPIKPVPPSTVEA